jgi:hypothetical protein
VLKDCEPRNTNGIASKAVITITRLPDRKFLSDSNI